LVQKDSTPPTITGPASATGANSSISIPENSTAVHTFTANESVTWSKSGSDETFFSIASNGVLTITSRDFESPADNGGNNTYIVTITATDGASNATTQTLTVTITNINEAPTITTASSAATYAITQPENISSVVTYAATDIDVGSSLTFSISGTDAADFSIDSSTGLLEFVANPDFEAPADGDTNNTYVVVITVSDGSLSDTQELTVTITNVNENSNIGAPTVSGTINKGISITITVTSDVAGKVRFFVGGKRITKCLARSTAGSYPSFSATCSWKPPVTGRHNLTARIAPTNNSYSASTSAATSVWVNRRTNSR
jgi:VCBS repeat-containing protein